MITRSKRDFICEDDIDNDNPISPDGRSASHPAGLYDCDSMTDCSTEEDDDMAERHKFISGFTESGEKFEVPPTRDTVGMLMRLNEIPTLVTWACIAFTIYIALPQRYLGFPVLDYFGRTGYPRHYLLGVAVFWRLMYNVTLGKVLDYQSRTKGLTKFVRDVSSRKSGFSYNIIAILLRGTLGGDPIVDKPPEFNAWVLNTQFVNVILPNDVFAFLMYAWMELYIPGYGYAATTSRVGLSTTAQASLFDFIPSSIMDSRVYVAFYGVVYFVGITLVVTSSISKMLSHDIIGYYAWFWVGLRTVIFCLSNSLA